MIGLLDGMSRATKLKFISTRHEQIAAHAADGYARLTHKASVLMCHLGPGLTNTLTGVANASLDSIPMVVICGDVPSYYFGCHAHQEVIMHGDATQYRLFEPIAKRVWRIDDAESLPYILDKAFRLAESGRPGPVVIDIPMDMFSYETEDFLWERTYMDSHETIRPGLDPDTAMKIAENLVNAKNPVIYAGGVLLSQASEELAALAEFLEIPVARTLMGQSYNPKWEEAAKAYGVDSVRVNSADEFLPAMKKAVEMAKAGKLHPDENGEFHAPDHGHTHKA